MEFDELLITTGVDALVRLVRDKQRLELTLAAKLLNIPETTLEEWARILEEEGILKIDYYLTKVYLIWIAPTEEKVKMEEESFYGQKQNLVREIEDLKSRLQPELESLEDLKHSFTEVYAKLGPRLETLEKELSGIAASPNDTYLKYSENVRSMDSRLNKVSDSLENLKSELSLVKKDLMRNQNTSTPNDLNKIKEEVNSMEKDLDNVIEKATKMQSKVPSELPASSEIKKKFISIKKDFEDVKGSTTKLREDMYNIQQSGGLLQEVADSIKVYEGKIKDIKTEMSTLSKGMDEIRTKSVSLSEKIQKDVKAIEQFSDSIEVAKEVLDRFPSQQDLKKELERLKTIESSVVQKINALESLLAGLPDIKNFLTEFNEVRKRAEEKRTELEEQLELLTKTNEDQTTTYSVFQKIKERTLVSIQAYSSQLSVIEDEIKKLKKESTDVLSAVDIGIQKYRDKSGKGETEVGSAFKDIKDKKEILGKIDTSIDSISVVAANLEKRLSLLSKEASLLEIRSGGSSTPKDAEKEKELMNQVSLTREEENDFKKKREELRDLIKKLWEES